MDAETEQAIFEVMEGLALTRTVVVISHQLRAVENAGCIYVIDGGHVAESGTHEELLAKEGKYAELWNQQAQLERFVAFSEKRAAKPFVKDDGMSGSGACKNGETEASSSRIDATAIVADHCGAESRSHLRVMMHLVRLVSPLLPYMIAAVSLGVAGFLCAIFMPTLAALALAEFATAQQTVPFAALLAIICVLGVARGPLHYGE